MITLQPVTEKNLYAVLQIQGKPNQRHYVSSTAESLAQAYAYSETAYPFAVCNDNQVVGFIMMGYYAEKEYYTLWKLLIDARHQGLGYGKRAVTLGIDFLKRNFQVDKVYTGVLPDNLTAKRLYLSLGFQETGLFENGMEEMCLLINTK